MNLKYLPNQHNYRVWWFVQITETNPKLTLIVLKKTKSEGQISCTQSKQLTLEKRNLDFFLGWKTQKKNCYKFRLEVDLMRRKVGANLSIPTVQERKAFGVPYYLFFLGSLFGPETPTDNLSRAQMGEAGKTALKRAVIFRALLSQSAKTLLY